MGHTGSWATLPSLQKGLIHNRRDDAVGGDTTAHLSPGLPEAA